MLKAHATTVVEELFSEARMNCSQLEGDEPNENRLMRIEEQEVGIT